MASENKPKTGPSSNEAQKVQKVITPSITPWEEMDRLMEGVLPRGWMRPFRFEWPTWGDFPHVAAKFPRVDIIDRDAEIVVRAEVPGVDKKDLDVSISDNSVTVKGSTRREDKEEKGNYFHSEITTGSFSRTLALPGNVDSAKAKATFKDGVLELAVPKVEQSKRHNVKVE
jgi:HSP20 family protein